MELNLVSHSGRSFFEHLVGTYELLLAWDQPQSICLGGLFHSIYGTDRFSRKTLDWSQRKTVQKIIGARAETLSYLFCRMDRRTLLQQSEKPRNYLIYDRIAQRNLRISKAQWRALIMISAANWLEQDPRHKATLVYR